MPGAIGFPGPDSSHTGSFHRGGGATAGHGRDSRRRVAATGARVPRCVTSVKEPAGLRALLVDGIPDGMDDVATVLAEGVRLRPERRGGLPMKKLSEIMRPGFLFVVQREVSVREAVRIMTANNVGIVIVLAGDRLAGVFSERDVVRRVVDQGLDPYRTPVGEVMTTDIVIGDPDEEYPSAMRKMDQANIRHLLVVKGAQMLSMISIRDLIRLDMQDKGDEIRYLREYLYQEPPEPARARLDS
jgi:CBS domain-containing protein